MATTVLRPDSTITNDFGIEGGAGATAHGVLSDENTATYLTHASTGRQLIVTLGNIDFQH